MQLKSLAVTIACTFALATSAEARKFNVELTPTKGGKVSASVSSVKTDTTVNYPGGPAPANIVGTFDGTDPTWSRPATSTALGGNYNGEPSCAGGAVFTVTDNVFYDTYTINNTGALAADVTVTSEGCGAGPVDTVFYRYTPSFSAATPTANCVEVHDDISQVTGSENYCSTLTFSIPAGGTTVLVVSSWCDDTSACFAPPGDYTLNFGGTTPVELQSFEVN